MNIFYPLIAVLIWSFNSIVIKVSAGVIDPASISFYRWIVAFIILTPFLLPKVIKEFHLIKKHLFQFAILGALGMFLYQTLAYYAAATTSAALIGIANGIIPLLTLFLSLFILKESPTIALIVGGALSFIGLILIISKGNPYSLIENGVGFGEILLFFASLAYALYGVLIKKWDLQVSKPASLYIQIFFGLICIAPLFIMEGHSELNGDNIPLILYAGVFASIIAPFTWIMGITKLGANYCSFFMNLAPFFTALFALFLLHEDLGWSFIIGGILVLVGVFIAQFIKFGTQKKE